MNTHDKGCPLDGVMASLARHGDIDVATIRAEIAPGRRLQGLDAVRMMHPQADYALVLLRSGQPGGLVAAVTSWPDALAYVRQAFPEQTAAILRIAANPVGTLAWLRGDARGS